MSFCTTWDDTLSLRQCILLTWFDTLNLNPFLVPTRCLEAVAYRQGFRGTETLFLYRKVVLFDSERWTSNPRWVKEKMHIHSVDIHTFPRNQLGNLAAKFETLQPVWNRI